MKMFWFVLSLYCFLFPSAGYAGPGKLKVVAANSIIADWVRNIAGQEIQLDVLVGPNGDVHTFEPTPLDDVTLSKADVIFEIGFGLEHWMDKLYKASGSHAKRVVLTNGLISQPLTVWIQNNHYEIDPHVWHNVRYVTGMVKKIEQALKKFDPDHSQVYEAHAQAYLKQLEELDEWVKKTTSQIPKSRRKLVTNHDSLGYFCERYQFALIGTAFDSFSTEAEDPSAKNMANLIFKIKNTGIHVLFAENIQNSKVIDSLSREAHVRLAPPLYTDALGDRNSPADTYIKMIHYNVQTIVSELAKDQSL